MKAFFVELVQVIRVFFGFVDGVSREQTAAISELRSYSDRELADLGISRGSIIEAVLHGRSMEPSSRA